MPLFDVQPIRDLGQQWADTGERLFEYLHTMHGSVLGMTEAWTGRASRKALQVWTGVAGHNVWTAVWQSAYVVRAIGEAILQYADELQKTMEEIQKARLVEGLTALFGMLIGVAAFGAAGVIGGLLSVIGRLSQTMVAVVSRLTSATSLLGRTAAFTTESIINAAATLGGDLLAQYAGSKAAGVPFKVDWEGAGINMGLGVWMGAGITGPHLFPGAASKVEGLGAKVPVRDLPTNVNVPLPRPGSVGVPKPPDGLPGIPNLGNWNLGPYNTTKLVTSAGGAPAPSVTGGPVTGVTRSSAGTQGVHAPDPGVVQRPRNAVSRTSAAPARPGTPVPETAAPTPVRPSGAVGGEQRPVTPLRGNETPVTGTPQAFLDAPPRSVRDGFAEPPAPHPATQGNGTAGRNAVSAGGNEVPVPDPVPAYGGNTQSGNTQGGSTSAVRGQGSTVSAPVATGVPDTPSGAGATGLRPGAPARSEAGHALWEAGRTDADGGSTAPVVPNGHETAVTGRTGADAPRNLQGTSAAEAVRGRSTEPPLPAAASPDRPAVGGGRSPSGSGEFGEPRGMAAPARGRQEPTVPVRAETRTGAEGPVRSEAAGTGPLGGAEGLSPAGAAGSRTAPGSRAFADLVLDRLSPEQQAKGIPEREAGGRYQSLETQYRQRYGEGFPQTLSAEQRASVVARSLRDPAALPDVFDSVRNGTFTADGPSGDRRPLSTSAERRPEASDRATSGIPGAGGQPVPATAEPSLAHTTADTAAGPAGAPEPPAPTARNTPEPTPAADGPAPALRPRTDDPARAELWTALRQEQEQRYTSVLEAEERLLTHQRELDAVWDHAHETFARGNPTAAESLARDSHEAFAAQRKWRDDITGAFQDEVRESGHVSGDAFDRIVGTAKENAYKYLVRAERIERFTTQFKERVSAYQSDPYGLGGHLPQFDTVPTRYLYDAGLGLYVRGDSAAHGLPGSPGGRPRPGPDGEGEAVLPDGVAAVDHFRDKSHDFNPLEQHYLGTLGQLDAVLDTYIRDHADTRGTLSPEQAGRLDALLDDAYAGIDRVAVRERDLHGSTAHAFEDLVRRYTAGDEDLGTGAENPTYNLGEEAVGRVLQEFRRDLRVVHEAVHARDAADVSGPGSGRAADGGPDPLWHEAVSQALGGVETRLRHEEFVQYRLAEETGYAERALAALPEDAAARLGTDGRLRVVAGYLDAVRVAAGRHHAGSTRTDGNTGGGPRASWTAGRDTLRATLPERVRHEGDLRHLVAGSAGDFHRIAGHPDARLSFRVPEETVAKLGDDFRTERVTEYDALFAPEGHRTDVWLAHESVHGSGFRSALENLRTGGSAGPADRPEPGPGPAGRGASGNTDVPDRPSVASDDPSAPGGTDPVAPVRQGRGDDPATAAPTPPSTAGRQAAAGVPETAWDVPAGGGQMQALADPRHAAGGPGTRSQTVSAPGRTAGDRARQTLRDDAHGERFRTLVDGHLPRGHRDGGLTTRDVAAAYDEVGALYGHELLGRAHEETRAVAVARHLRGEDLDGFFADLERRYTAEGPSLTERVNSAVDHTFTRAEVEQAHRGLLERHPFLADLSDRVRAKAVAAHLARPMDELAQATRSLLAQRHGIVLERVAPVQRVHRELTERFGARFTALPVGERAAVVAEELRYERSPVAGRDANPVAGPVQVGRRTAAGPPRTVDTGTPAEAVDAPVRPGTRRPAAPETTTGPTAAHPVTDPSVPERSGASRPATDHADAPGVPPENLSDVDVPPVGTAAEAAVPDGSGSDLGAEDVRIDAGAALTEARGARDAALSHFVDAEERHLSGVGGSAEADGSRLARAWERFVDAEALLEAAEEGWARTTGGAPLPEVRDVEARPGVLPGGSRFTDGLRGLLRRPKPAAAPEGVVLSVSPLPAAPHVVIDAAKARRLLGEKGYLLVPTSRDLTVAHWLHHPGRAESEFAADAEALAGARATAVENTLIGVLDTRIASLADDFALFRRLGTRQVWDTLRTPQTAALVMVERRGLRSMSEDRAELMSRLRGGAWPWAREYLLGGDTDAVLEPLVDSVLRHLRDDLSLTVNVDLGRPAVNASSTLDAMLQDTTVLLRNAWETMSGNDRYLSQVRGPAEESLGYASVLKRTRPAGGTHPDTTGRPDALLAPDDLDRSLLPVYAALTSENRPQALPQYGSAVFHLKHEVIERATFTPTDSFGLGPRGAEGATGLGNLVPLLNHGAESLVRLAFAEATGFAFDARSRRLRDSGTLPSVLQGYFEAQIHGRVTWQDLERVVLFHHAEDENRVQEALGQKQALEAFARDQGFSFTVETAPVVQGEQPLVPGTQPPREPVPVTDPVVHESFDELHFVASLLDERGVPHEGLLTGDVPSGRPAGATAAPAERGERGAGAAPSWSVRSVDAVLGRGVRVLDRAGLEAVAGEVLAGRGVWSVGEWPVEECLVLLEGLRGVLFPRGVAVGRVVDDGVVGVGARGDRLVAGARWGAVGEWGSVAEALRVRGAGTAAFVLARRPGGVGHAFAAYAVAPVREGEGVEVVWIDLQQPDPGRRLGQDPPRIAPAEARALVIGSDARVVADALPEFRPSASTGQAMADPATDHHYGAIGFEGEIPQMLNWESSTGNAYSTIIAIHSPSGSRLEVDSMAFYEAGGAYYESMREASAYGSATYRTGRIPEFVSSPARVFDGENFENSESILWLFEETRHALAVGGGDVIGGGKTLGEILRRENGWKVSPEFRDVRIEPVLRGDSQGRVYTQFTVGVPVGGILHLLEQVASRRDRWQADELLEPSRTFGEILAEQFVVQYYRRSLGPGEIEGMRDDPLVREVWGYGWLLFNHVAAVPFHSVAKKDVMVKNLLQVALRNPFGEVRKVLQEPVRQFLEHWHDGIVQLFQDMLVKVFRDAMLSWNANHSVFSAFLAPGHTTGDYLSYGLNGRNAVSQSVGVGMDSPGYETLSEHHGTKLILLEIRKVGENSGSLLPGEVSKYFHWLKEAVLPFFAEDQANAWRRALRAYSDLAGLNFLEYREGTPLWHALKHVADMGRSPDPKSREIVAFVAQKLREGASGPSGGDVVVRRAEVGGVLEGLRRVYADKGLSVKARAVLGGILASWESNAGMPVLPPGVVRVPSALPEDLALVSGPSWSVRSVDAVLGRGVRVLDRAGLEAVAGEVLAGRGVWSVGEWPVEECLVLLEGLRGVLFPRGVAVGRVVDDGVVGVGARGDRLVAGARWGAVGEWGSVAEALRVRGAGTAAFVLARRPGGVGHAFAAYAVAPVREGEGVEVVWIDLQQPDPGRRLGQDPPRIAPAEARALVIGSDARVVADALPEFRPSASTGQAMADPATDHHYGAIGFEIEFNQVLDKDRAFDLAYGKVLATHVLGAQIEVDYMNVFRVGGDLYFTPEDASRHTRLLKAEEHWVAEFVSPPGRVLDSESWEQDLPSVLSTAAMTRSMLANAPAGTTLQQVLSDDPGWIVSNEYAGVTVHPAPLGAARDAAYTQFTVGVPAGGLFSLLHLVEGREHAPYRRRLLSAARMFGKSLAEEYVRSTGEIRLGPGEIELLSEDPSVREVWGYGWLLFSQVAAYPYGQRYFPKKITKNMTSAALRNPLGLVRSTLRPSVQEFLHEKYPAIRQEFSMALWSLLENKSAAGVPVSELVKSLFVELSDESFVVDYLEYGLSRSAARAVSQQEAVGMNDYPDLDVISGVPSMLLELRNIGSRHGRMTQDDLRHYSKELFDTVRSFSDDHDSDQADRNDLGGMVERLRARPEVVQAARLLAFFPELREIRDKPIQELANSSHVPFLTRSLGDLALRGTALPPRAVAHLMSLATALRDALAQGRLSPDVLGGHAQERLNDVLTATLTVTAQHSAQQGGPRAGTSRSAAVTSAAPRSGAASTAVTSGTRGPYAHVRSDAQAERAAYPEPSAAAWNKWLPTIEWARSHLDRQAETDRSPLLQDARKIVARHHIAPATDRGRRTRQTSADRYRQVHADVVNVVAGYLHQERLGSKPQGRAVQISRQLADELGTRPPGNAGGHGDVQVFMAATDHTVDKGLGEVLTDVLATGGPADLERLGRAIGTRRAGQEPSAPGEADGAERGAGPSRLHEESNSPTRPPEVDVPERAGQEPGPVAQPAGGRADAVSEDLPEPHVLRARTAGAAGEPGRRQASPPRPIRFRERVALAVREWDKPLPEAVEDLEQLLRDAGQGARSLVLGGEPATVLWAVNVGGEIQWKDRSLMPAQAPWPASGPVRSIDLTPSSELISPPQELLDAGGGATRFCQISPGANLRGVM